MLYQILDKKQGKGEGYRAHSLMRLGLSLSEVAASGRLTHAVTSSREAPPPKDSGTGPQLETKYSNTSLGTLTTAWSSSGLRCCGNFALLLFLPL